MILRLLVRFVVLSALIAREGSSLSGTATADDLVKKACSHKLDFKSIREFQEFATLFRQLESKLSEDENKNDISSATKRCFEDKHEIFALEELVRHYDKVRPCRFSEIAKLESHAKRYYSSKKRPLGLKFFTLFGVNIGFICKLNLLAHLRQADNEADQLDFIYSMASPTGWKILVNEHTKKSMKFGSSSQIGNQVPNRLAKLVPGLNLISQLDYMSFDHLKNSKRGLMDLVNGVEKGLFRLESGNRLVAGKIVEYVRKIVESCRNLDQLYLNFILSLARLNELGLLVTYDKLLPFYENNILLHKWLAATSFCQLMVRVEIAGVSAEDEQGSPGIEMEIIHDDNLLESRRKLYSYAAEFGEIRQEAIDSVWTASVPEGAWRQEDQAMFREKAAANRDESAAMVQLEQYLRGLEQDILDVSERQHAEL